MAGLRIGRRNIVLRFCLFRKGHENMEIRFFLNLVLDCKLGLTLDEKDGYIVVARYPPSEEIDYRFPENQVSYPIWLALLAHHQKSYPLPQSGSIYQGRTLFGKQFALFDSQTSLSMWSD